MAIKKNIKLENGITVNYHRIVSVNSITNITSLIEVASYISEEERQKEQRYQELQQKNMKKIITAEEKIELDKGINVFIDTKYYSTDYDKELNVDNAYDYLKTLDIFQNSKDI